MSVVSPTLVAPPYLASRVLAFDVPPVILTAGQQNDFLSLWPQILSAPGCLGQPGFSFFAQNLVSARFALTINGTQLSPFGGALLQDQASSFVFVQGNVIRISDTQTVWTGSMVQTDLSTGLGYIVSDVAFNHVVDWNVANTIGLAFVSGGGDAYVAGGIFI